ncbi:MAG TPA: hypothetical protein VK454_03160 [Myxococcaceae bacterium]|nr:hypothetical protein [Myxococcaceae bacterium]
MNAHETPARTIAAGGNAKRPFAVFTIVEGDGEKALWRRVGSGFVNRDGSYNLYLEALPVNGKLHMRESDQAPLNPERA